MKLALSGEEFVPAELKSASIQSCFTSEAEAGHHETSQLTEALVRGSVLPHRPRQIDQRRSDADGITDLE